MEYAAHTKKNIFIVEDDPNSSDFLRSLLENEGYECTTHYSGETAINSLKTGTKADLILLDIMMEGMDGYEVCKILKSDSKLRYIPIIIISGKSSVEEKILGLQLGADDYLVKPFKNKELLAKIQVLLRIKNLQDQLIHVEKLAGIGQLAAGIAHEFNNLIGGMLGYAQLGMMNLDDKEMVSKSFSIIESSCFRAKELTENMLLFSSNQIKTDATASIENCVDQCKVLLSNELNKHNISLYKDYQHTSKVKIDANRFLQIFVNLVRNAIQAIAEKKSDEKQSISIKTVDAPNTTIIEITDTGIGIKEEHLDRIFEPFFTTKGALGGGDSGSSGMGLSVVYGIISAHNGSILLANTSQAGTTFQIKLPSQPVEAAVELKNVMERQEELTYKKENFEAAALIVDDELIYRDLLSDALQKTGMQITSVASGEEAIEKCKDQKFDIIFMDYLMPGIGGIKAANLIQTDKEQGKIVFISGRSIIKNLKESIGDEGFYFLAKPFNLKEMLSLIKKLIPEKTNG